MLHMIPLSIVEITTLRSPQWCCYWSVSAKVLVLIGQPSQVGGRWPSLEFFVPPADCRTMFTIDTCLLPRHSRHTSAKGGILLFISGNAWQVHTLVKHLQHSSDEKWMKPHLVSHFVVSSPACFRYWDNSPPYQQYRLSSHWSPAQQLKQYGWLYLSSWQALYSLPSIQIII